MASDGLGAHFRPGPHDHPLGMTTPAGTRWRIRAMQVRFPGFSSRNMRLARPERPKRIQSEVNAARVTALSVSMRGRSIRCHKPHSGVRHSERVPMSAENFEIVVKGRLTPTLVAAIDGFEVSHCDEGLTHLVGWVPDQARLHSLLTVLRDLNIEIRSVKAVDFSEPDSHQS
jgi:hypothetical protein